MILAAFRRPDFFAEGRAGTEGGGMILGRFPVGDRVRRRFGMAGL